jgi:hypothetical protein
MNTNIISYNVLNHKKSNLIMLLRKYEKNIINKIIKNEMKRYNIIDLKLIEKLKNYPDDIILLQEVNETLLQKLKKIFFLFHTDSLDKEYRVIILPNNYRKYKIIKHDILLVGQKTKNALMLIINDLVLINVHLYWKSTETDISNFAEKIYGEIYKKTCNKKIIIGGDFNKSIEKVQKFFINNFNTKLVNNYKDYENKFTSYSTDITDKKDKDIIDHILTTPNIKTNNTEIIEDDLFIDLDTYTKILMNEYFGSKYISDHKMIKLNIDL